MPAEMDNVSERKQNGRRPEVLIIGLDGGTFDLIKPWVKEGHLPHFARLMKDGIFGDLTSTVPPVTPPAWTSFMTGKNPGKHGLFDFLVPERHGYKMQYTNGRFRKGRPIWKILGDSGVSVGVINVPMTYPPEPVNGFLISGMDTPDEQSEYTYPSSLKEELVREVGGIPVDIRHLGHMKTDETRDQTLYALENLEDQRTRAAMYLMEKHPTDVFMIVFNATDQVQHHFWHYLDSNHPQYDSLGARKYQDAILRIYKKVDHCMGQLISKTSKETSVILVSDHGAGPVGRHYIHLNRFLAQLGVLKTIQKQNGLIRATGWLAWMIRQIDQFLRGSLAPNQKLRLAKYFPKLRESVESYLSFGGIDWESTQAYAFENTAVSPNIWINLKGTRPNGTVQSGEEYNKLVEFLREQLLKLSDPVTGEPIIHKVYRKNEIYSGENLETAPDLILDWWNGNHFVARQSFPCREDDPVVVRREGPLAGGLEWSGTHRMNGIGLFRGPVFVKGQSLAGATIMDLAPTILYLLGVPIPKEMDGKVMEQVFDPGFLKSNVMKYEEKSSKEPSISEQEQSYSEEEAEKIRERLEGLGYLE